MHPNPTNDPAAPDSDEAQFDCTLMSVLETLEGRYAAAGRGYALTLRDLGYPEEGAELIAAAFVIEMQSGMIRAAWNPAS